MIWSLVIIGGIATLLLRSHLAAEVQLFIAKQRRLEDQARLIEQQIEINEHIKAFLPKKLYNQVISIVNTKQVTYG